MEKATAPRQQNPRGGIRPDSKSDQAGAPDQPQANSGGGYPAPRIPSSAQLAANAALSLLNLACYLLDRQIAAQAKAFENEGGFTERLYRIRKQKRGY